MSANGVLGDPAGASADEGRRLLDQAVDDLVGTAGAARRTAAAIGVPGGRVESGSPWSPVPPGASAPPPSGVWPRPAGRWWRSTAASDDPRLPYPMGTRAELDAVVAIGPGRLARTGVVGVGPTSGTGSWPTGRRHRSRGAGRRRWPMAEERFGGLDAMVAVAGVIAGGVPLWEMPADQLGAVLDVDLGGPITAARVGIPALLRRPAPRSGRFLAVASAAATRGLPMLAAYGAAKAGVAGLVRGLAAELADSGVTANAISPGSTATAILDESARLYGLERHRHVRRPAAGQAPAAPRGGGGGAGVAGRPRQQWLDRCGHPRGRRPLVVTGLPEGFGLDLDRSVRTFDRGRVLVGGHPGRLMTLSSGGRRRPRFAGSRTTGTTGAPGGWEHAW